MNTRRELAGRGPAHPPLEAGRQAEDSQSWKARGNLRPRDGILFQTTRRLPVAGQLFVASWMVDICQEGRSQRPAIQGRHTEHLRPCSGSAPGKTSGLDQGGYKTHQPTWGACTHQASGRLSCSDLSRAQNAGPAESVLCGVSENLNISCLDLGSACNPGAALERSPA